MRSTTSWSSCCCGCVKSNSSGRRKFTDARSCTTTDRSLCSPGVSGSCGYDPAGFDGRSAGANLRKRNGTRRGHLRLLFSITGINWRSGNQRFLPTAAVVCADESRQHVYRASADRLHFATGNNIADTFTVCAE